MYLKTCGTCRYCYHYVSSQKTVLFVFYQNLDCKPFALNHYLKYKQICRTTHHVAYYRSIKYKSCLYL